MKKLRLTLEISDEEHAALQAYASDRYAPNLGIDWRDVASSWAKAALKEKLTALLAASRDGSPQAE